MDEEMDVYGRTDRPTDGWMDGCIDRRTNGWMERRMNGDGWTNGWMDGDWWRDGWTDGWADRRTDGWVYEWIMDGLTILSVYYNGEVLGEKHPLV